MQYRKLGQKIPTSFSDKQNYSEEEWLNLRRVNRNTCKQIHPSPGGVSSMWNHYTGGFYGKGGSSTDKFIGPDSDPYLTGVYGDMYQKNGNLREGFVPEQSFVSDFELIGEKKKTRNTSVRDVNVPLADAKLAFGENSEEMDLDTQSVNTPPELVVPPNVVISKNIPRRKKIPTFWWALSVAVVLICLFIALSLWNTTAMNLLKKYTNGGVELGTNKLVFYSVVATVVLVLLCWLLGVSFLNILETGIS